MYKEATDMQVDLCKWAAVERFKQYGLPEVTGEQLYTAFIEKLAQATRTPQPAQPPTKLVPGKHRLNWRDHILGKGSLIKKVDETQVKEPPIAKDK